jgi:hypothetical protein
MKRRRVGWTETITRTPTGVELGELFDALGL